MPLSDSEHTEINNSGLYRTTDGRTFLGEMGAEADSAGNAFMPDNHAKAYTYPTATTMLCTITDDANVTRVRTYTFDAAGNILNTSKWMVQ